MICTRSMFFHLLLFHTKYLLLQPEQSRVVGNDDHRHGREQDQDDENGRGSAVLPVW